MKSVKYKVKDRIWGSVRFQMSDRVYDQTWDQVRKELHNVVWDEVWDEAWEKTIDRRKEDEFL